MPRKGGRARKEQKPQKKWDLYPEHHGEVAIDIEAHDLSFEFNYSDDQDCIKEHETYVMGRFVCKNPVCSHGVWTSKKIFTTIRLYKGKRYNARVYFQKCRRCKHTSKPKLDSSYADRVAYRLKLWSNVPVKGLKGDKIKGPPHESV
ncbi:zinc-binding domain-containing protein [Ophiocordyceps camponoti-floridani]|uniref:Zinc-binding domain-containing protein n=1 Tax=Ophiocordyceps camponoti-floridani TaxID=2030778 RepID=A0A8H4QAN4_9HYPO|nr:zinc-binding domain-containing protein [Ophiocordyceps camponoti-floridani]